MQPNPQSLGYRMPAEWEKHSAIWLSWPHDAVTFPDRVEKVEKTYTEIIQAISGSELVNLFMRNAEEEKRISEILKAAGVNLTQVKFWKHNYADVWFRDYGPIFVKNAAGELAITHWIFNAWGSKYATLMPDTIIPKIINEKLQLPYFTPGIVMEGGSIEVNGLGTLLTSKQCLLNPNRNPTLTQAEIEKKLAENLNITNFIWLEEGIAGDDTDGHIDDIARFVNPTTVVCTIEKNTKDPNYAILQRNLEILKAAKDQDGKPLEIITLPTPIVEDSEGRLPASYTNFYIGNTVVLVPIFSDKNDAAALEILQKLFPERKVVGINCRDLVYGLGTLHCISQQQPE